LALRGIIGNRSIYKGCLKEFALRAHSDIVKRSMGCLLQSTSVLVMPRMNYDISESERHSGCL